MKRFRGWEPSTETVYERDTRGRVVRAVTTVETEWDDEQSGWMLALADHEADLCPDCGQPRSEAMSPDAEGMYEVDGPYEDHACLALAVHMSRAEHKHPSAMRYVVRRRRG